MCPTSGMSMPMGLCSSTPSRHQPSIALSTTTTTSAPRRTRLAKSGARISVLKQVGALCGRWGLDEVLAVTGGDRAGVTAGRGRAAGGRQRARGGRDVAADSQPERSSPSELVLSHPAVHGGFSWLREEPEHICLQGGDSASQTRPFPL